MTKKVSFDILCERLGTYIVKLYSNKQNVIVITKDLHIDPFVIFEAKNKPENLTEEGEKIDVDKDINTEEIKAYARELKLLKLIEKIIQFSIWKLY